MEPARLRRLAFGLFVLFAGGGSRAQEPPPPPQEAPTTQELLDRIELLEIELQELKSEKNAAARQQVPRADLGLDSASLGASPGLMGRLGQTTRFSSTFNPAIGVAVDAIGNANTRRESGPNQDGFWLRAAELNLAAQIDPFGYGYVTLEALSGEEDEIELIEAAGVLNRLPANLSLKAGKLLSDFGKLGQRHEHELPFFEKPGVTYDYFGGSLNPVGFELHQWFGLTDHVPLRWSVGVGNKLQGHGHRLGGEHVHGDEVEAFGKRHLDNCAYTGRATGYKDLTDRASLQLGGSVAWAPELWEFEAGEMEGDVERIETRRTVAGLDLTYKWIDASSQEEFILGTEAFKSYGTFEQQKDEGAGGADGEGPTKEESLGGYGWAEYSWSPYWATGVLAGLYQLAAGESLGRGEYAAWITWKVSHFNWIRLQYRFHDLERGDPSDLSGEDYHEAVLQWLFVFGSHAHGLDW
ncbi:MAG: hypothetical protein AB1486_23320 [Planctomycetota bacterium]